LSCISLIMECFHIDRHFWSDRLIGQSCRGGFSLAEAAWGCLLIGWSCRGDFLLAKAAGAPSHWLKMLGGANSLAKAPGFALIGQRVCALQCIGYHSFQNDVTTKINKCLIRKRSGRFLVQLNTKCGLNMKKGHTALIYSLFHIKGIFGVTIVFYFKCTLSTYH